MTDDKAESIELIRACAKQLRAFRENLIWALDECRDGPQRSLIVRDISYIHNTAQALINAAGITSSSSRGNDQDAPVTSVALPALITVPTDQTPATEATGTRRKHSDAFDLLLLMAVYLQPQLTYPVGLDILHTLAVAFDPAVQRPSLTSKLARWKGDKVLRWKDPNDMSLLPDGEALRKTRLKRCRAPGGRLDEVARTLHSVLGLDPKFD